MFRGLLFWLSSIFAFSSSAIAQVDQMAIFSGVWVAVNPPGPHVVFNLINSGQREASLPIIGQAMITASNGEDGSNFRISGPGFTCFYLILTTSQRTRMVWELKSGPDLCFKTAAFEQADSPLPVTAAPVSTPVPPQSSSASIVARPQARIYPSFPCSARLN